MFLLPVGIVGYRVWRQHQEEAAQAAAATREVQEPGDAQPIHVGIEEIEAEYVVCDKEDDHGWAVLTSPAASSSCSGTAEVQVAAPITASNDDSREQAILDKMAVTNSNIKCSSDDVNDDITVDALIRDGFLQGIANLWRDGHNGRQTAQVNYPKQALQSQTHHKSAAGVTPTRMEEATNVVTPG